MFVRVRSAVPGAPRHEFDVPVREYEHRKDRYVLVDGDPVKLSRPPKYVKKSAPAKKPRAKKPAENKNDAPAGA